MSNDDFDDPTSKDDKPANEHDDRLPAEGLDDDIDDMLDAADKRPELRKHQRVRAAFRVEVVHPETGTIASQTRDISESGAFIKIDNQLLAHKDVEIQIRVLGLPTGPGELVTSRVVRVEEEGIGVLFIEVGNGKAANDD